MDRKIIMELQSEKYCRHASLAKKLQISQSTVSRRIKRLLKEKIIRMIGVPDINAMGYHAIAMIAIDVEIKKIEEICQELAKYPEVHTIAMTFGRFDILVSVYFTTMDTLVEFIKKELSHIEGILNIETFYIAEMKKLTFGWLPR